MSVSILDPMTKLEVQMAGQALDKLLDAIAAKHPNDHKVADLIKASKAGLDGLVAGLVNYQG